MEMKETGQGRCPICGEGNSCAVAETGSFEALCWCRDYIITKKSLDQLPTNQRNKSCICIHCIDKFESGN